MEGDKQLATLSVVSAIILLIFAVLFIFGLEGYGNFGQAVKPFSKECSITKNLDSITAHSCIGFKAYIVVHSLMDIHVQTVAIEHDQQTIFAEPNTYFVVSSNSIRV